MARIPDETIDEIIAATDIVDVIGSAVKLRRAGAGYKGLCPFHVEKTPSFNVTPSRNTFKCFGCGAGGTVIRFVMDYENLAFRDAVERLAEKAGITLPEEEYDPQAEARSRIRKTLIRAHKEAAEFYHLLLMKHDSAKGAREYLKGRGINGDIAREWKLGYAPNSEVPLTEWCLRRNVAPEALAEAGIHSRRDRGEAGSPYYARFRDRLMFSICNDHGDVIAFSGRLLDPDAKAAKYLNSPETPIFKKSKTFFGLNKTKRAILRANQAIVCEGQLDLITCHAAGIENMVAPLGTAFTPDHARILKRHAEEIVLCYDSDNAGQKAAGTAFEHLAKLDVPVRAAKMPEGHDPDTLVREQGAEAFKTLIKDAPEFFRFQLQRLAEVHDLDTMAGRVRAAREAASLIYLLPTQVSRDSATMDIARRLQMDPAELRKITAEAKAEAERQEQRGQRFRDRDDARGAAPGSPGEPAAPADPPFAPPTSQAILGLCRLALIDPAAKEAVSEPAAREIFADTPGAVLLRKIAAGNFDASSASSVATFLSNLSIAEEDFLSGLTSEAGAAPLGGAPPLIMKLESERLTRQLAAIKARMATPGLPPDELAELHGDYLEVNKEFLDLESRRKDIPRP